MSEEERENKLEHEEFEIEYLVHGRWNRSESDAKGRFGAWWVDLHYARHSPRVRVARGVVSPRWE